VMSVRMENKSSKDICLLALFGLPGSGKTSLAKRLVSLSAAETMRTGTLHVPTDREPLQFIHICYDYIFPASLQSKFVEHAGSDGDSEWKKYRTGILNCLDDLISQGFTLTSDEDGMVASNISGMNMGLRDRFNLCVNDRHQKNGNIVYVIDDNLYYTSMRYEYLQLAKKYQISFAQVYVTCDFKVAQERNLIRNVNEQVPQEVISAMAGKLEPPDESRNWQRYSHTWNTELAMSMEPIIELIWTSLADPVIDVEERLRHSRMASRVLCSTNLLHQSDQILRRLISSEMANVSKLNITKEKLKVKAADLLTKKSQILEDLRKGLILVEKDWDCENISAKDLNSPLFCYLSHIFNT
jgi:O-phosphoseryl-tRNA(Sec) kinase